MYSTLPCSEFAAMQKQNPRRAIVEKAALSCPTCCINNASQAGFKAAYVNSHKRYACFWADSVHLLL